eukprot:scaffold2982_cov154-Isochrysis_galbana.AAC.5
MAVSSQSSAKYGSELPGTRSRMSDTERGAAHGDAPTRGVLLQRDVQHTWLRPLSKCEASCVHAAKSGCAHTGAAD